MQLLSRSEALRGSVCSLSCPHPRSNAGLCVPWFDSLQVSALFPVFAVLERQTTGRYEGSMDARLATLTVWVTESRLARLKEIVLALVAFLSVPEGVQFLESKRPLHRHMKALFHSSQCHLKKPCIKCRLQGAAFRMSSQALSEAPACRSRTRVRKYSKGHRVSA